jgi:hypothetical protein
VSDIKEQVEHDILRFFENIENQNRNAQRETLRNLLDKYVHLSTSDYLMDSADLREILGSAKGKFANDNAVIYLKSGVGNRKVLPHELANLFVIEATIGHLNKKGCLKKLAKFDKKDK